jgi:hypothetical protein
MTDELRRTPSDETYEVDRGADRDAVDPELDPPTESQGSGGKPPESNTWLKEGADAPDAADIEDPSEQR